MRGVPRSQFKDPQDTFMVAIIGDMTCVFSALSNHLNHEIIIIVEICCQMSIIGTDALTSTDIEGGLEASLGFSHKRTNTARLMPTVPLAKSTCNIGRPSSVHELDQHICRSVTNNKV